MADHDLLPVSYLRQRLRYEPDTGQLYWKHCEAQRPQWNGRYAGTKAFTSTRNTGYLHGRVGNKCLQAHRVAWALHHGVWPSQQIDHINGNKIDNCISNLRDVSQNENHKNQRRRKNNTSGVMGVSFYEQTKKWCAYVMVSRKKIHLGYFDLFDDAIAARKAAEVQYGFHANHGV